MRTGQKKLLARGLGILALTIGSGIFYLGLQTAHEKKAWPYNPWSQTQASIVRVVPNAISPGYFNQQVAFTADDGTPMRCAVKVAEGDAGEIGENVRVWVNAEAGSDYCDVESDMDTAGFIMDHLILVFGAIWILMGLAFLIRPPKNIIIGPDGSTGPTPSSF